MTNNITVIGNLTADPELRYTPNGLAVANATIASNKRVFDKQANEWKDGPTTFFRFSVWRELAEHLAQSVKKGQTVIATGEVKQTEWVDKDTQQKRTGFELEVEHIGPSLRFGTTEFRKSASPAQNAQAQAQYSQQGGNVQQQAQAAQAQGYSPAQQQAPGQYQAPPAQQMQQPVQQQAPAQQYDQSQQYAHQGQPVQQQAPQQQAVPAGVPAAGANPFGPGATDGGMF